MSARDKYIKIFGKFESLDEKVPWPMGLTNLFEWLTWSTHCVLGVTKEKYREQIVKQSYGEAIKGASLDAIQQIIATQIANEMKANEQDERYSLANSGIASSREALRRVKFFSENYLNKEFDIFWSLASDSYLDAFYSQFTKIVGGGSWFCHGNGGVFKKSTGLSEMQMDNLSYNPTEDLLVANELKLGSQKNRDQILKYALMFRRLQKDKFIKPTTRFALLFIGEAKMERSWNDFISEELAHCLTLAKPAARQACEAENIEVARHAEYQSITWQELVDFNEKYMAELKLPLQQVEKKLIWGFNETLATKMVMRPSKATPGSFG